MVHDRGRRARRSGAEKLADAERTVDSGPAYNPSRMWRFEAEPVEDSTEDAVAYWARVDPYTVISPWNERIATTVAEYQPASVIEFGSNAGRNLALIQNLLPDARLVGLDINPSAVVAGREKWGLDLRVGSVEALAELSADLAFTVSVIDHIPDPLPALDHLARTAPIVLLFEPWLGMEGKLTTRIHSETGETAQATPFSYSWDYHRLAANLGLPITEEPFAIETPLGPHYKLFRIEQGKTI